VNTHCAAKKVHDSLLLRLLLSLSLLSWRLRVSASVRAASSALAASFRRPPWSTSGRRGEALASLPFPPLPPLPLFFFLPFLPLPFLPSLSLPLSDDEPESESDESLSLLEDDEESLSLDDDDDESLSLDDDESELDDESEEDELLLELLLLLLLGGGRFFLPFGFSTVSSRSCHSRCGSGGWSAASAKRWRSFGFFSCSERDGRDTYTAVPGGQHSNVHLPGFRQR
jgi:hypothetical protein